MANLRPFSNYPLRSNSDNSLEERLRTHLSFKFEPEEPGHDLLNKLRNFLPCISFCLKDSSRSFEKHVSSNNKISELSIKSESSLSERENKESKHRIEWWHCSIHNLRKEKPVFSMSLYPLTLLTGGLNRKLNGSTFFSMHLWFISTILWLHAENP